MIRLIATDLDGTLLRSDGTVSSRSRRALRAAQDAGIQVVYATARPPRWFTRNADIGAVGLAICCNGAIVYDVAAATVRDTRPLSSHIVRDVVQALRAAVPGIRFGFEFGASFGWEPAFAAAHDDGTFPDAYTGDALGVPDEPMVKLVASHADVPLDAIVAVARTLTGISVTQSGGPFVEIAAAGIHKAASLDALCQNAGISAAEVIAFGDMPNDLPLLAWAGRSVAVANAHPEVLTAADEITASNDEDGVAIVIERLLTEDGDTPSTRTNLV